MVILPTLSEKSKDFLSKMKNTWNLSEEKRKMLEFGNDKINLIPLENNSLLGKRSFDNLQDLDKKTNLSV